MGMHAVFQCVFRSVQKSSMSQVTGLAALYVGMSGSDDAHGHSKSQKDCLLNVLMEAL
jgi:hypothetical protein